MGRVALLATRATELALSDAGLLGTPVLTDGATGVAYGSTSGSPPAMAIYARISWPTPSRASRPPTTSSS